MYFGVVVKVLKLETEAVSSSPVLGPKPTEWPWANHFLLNLARNNGKSLLKNFAKEPAGTCSNNLSELDPIIQKDK